MEILQYLAPLGVGVILAAFIFTVYRKDTRKAENEKLMMVVEYANKLEHFNNNQKQDRIVLLDTLERVNTSLSLGNELHRNLANEMRDLVREVINRK